MKKKVLGERELYSNKKKEIPLFVLPIEFSNIEAFSCELIDVWVLSFSCACIWYLTELVQIIFGTQFILCRANGDILLRLLLQLLVIILSSPPSPSLSLY